MLTVPTGVPPAPQAAAPADHKHRERDLRRVESRRRGGVRSTAGSPGRRSLRPRPCRGPIHSSCRSPRMRRSTLRRPQRPTTASRACCCRCPVRRAPTIVGSTTTTDGLVSLMVREGSLRQVIAMIAQTQKLNIVFAGATDTMVTASFERQPWQKVLDALLSASGHVWTTHDDVIFVSSVDAADFMPPERRAACRSKCSTSTSPRRSTSIRRSRACSRRPARAGSTKA